MGDIATERQPDGPEGSNGRSLPAYYSGPDKNRGHGVLNRTFSHLNPFKRGKGDWGWFNPEDFTNQKREWARQYGDQKVTQDHKLFESFFIAGLQPSTEVTDVTATAQTRKTARHDHVPLHVKEGKEGREHRGFKAKSMPAQILFSYPPEKEINSDVASFCFPHGVNPVLLERTPSMSSLNEIVYSQRFLHSDSSSFTFLMKVADNMPLYGVCCLMDEIVHKPPAIVDNKQPSSPPRLGRYLVSAPRCYCFLTHYPFFSLHMKVLHMIMGLERLDRITSFLEDATLVSELSMNAMQQQSQLAPHTDTDLHSSSDGRPLSRNQSKPNGLESPDSRLQNRSSGLGSASSGLPQSKPPGLGSSRSGLLPPKPYDSGSLKAQLDLTGPSTDQEGNGQDLYRPSPAARAAKEALVVALNRVSLNGGPTSSSSARGAKQDSGEYTGLEAGAFRADPTSLRSSSFTSKKQPTRPAHRRSSSVQLHGSSSSGSLNMAQRANSSSVSRASQRMQQLLEQKSSIGLPDSKSFQDLQQISNHSSVVKAPALALKVEESDGSETSFVTATSKFATIEDLSTLSPNRPHASSGSLSRLSGAPTPSPSGVNVASHRHWQSSEGPNQVADQKPVDGLGVPSEKEEQSELAVQDSEPSSRILKSHSFMPRKNAHAKPSPEAQPAGAFQVMQAYYATPLPKPGEEFEFSPDDTLQPVHFIRPALQFELSAPGHKHRMQIANAEAEAAIGLKHWAVSVLCRCLSLQNVLTLLAAILLEQQIVFFCPNLGLLSTAVLSVVPLIRPFAWQSLLMPVLPTQEEMLNLIDAPVPFILGVQYKTSDIAARCSSLVRVNIYKDQVKNADRLPSLPGQGALFAMLEPAYVELNKLGPDAVHSRPITTVTESEKQAADEFVKMIEGYLNGFCCNLHLHTITDVQTSDRVSLLLKESFIDSFASKDRIFIRMFVETQMFAVYCDTILQ